MDHDSKHHEPTQDGMRMPQDMKMSKSSYGIFLANLLASAVAMYFVMYTMIDSADELYNNISNVYMTLMMVSAMAVLMLLMMKSMFADNQLNLVLYIVFALLFAAGFAGMRTQALVGDRQFLRAMIPHHSGAVLMCQRATIRDPEIIALCSGIIASQKQEIAQMKGILSRK